MNFLKDAGIENPLLMAPFNEIGFQMNPSKEEAEKTLKLIPSRTIAMSTLAAGYIHPKNAYKYLSSLSKIKSVVVGASTENHIKETVDFIKASQI